MCGTYALYSLRKRTRDDDAGSGSIESLAVTWNAGPTPKAVGAALARFANNDPSLIEPVEEAHRACRAAPLQ